MVAPLTASRRTLGTRAYVLMLKPSGSPVCPAGPHEHTTWVSNSWGPGAAVHHARPARCFCGRFIAYLWLLAANRAAAPTHKHRAKLDDAWWRLGFVTQRPWLGNCRHVVCQFGMRHGVTALRFVVTATGRSPTDLTRWSNMIMGMLARYATAPLRPAAYQRMKRQQRLTPSTMRCNRGHKGLSTGEHRTCLQGVAYAYPQLVAGSASSGVHPAAMRSLIVHG